MVFQLHLSTERVDHIDLPTPLVVEPTVSVRSVFEMFLNQRRGCAVICVAGKVEGIFTERDALRLMASGGELDVPIEAVMTRNPAVVRADETIETAIARMSIGGYRRLPVVDNEMRPVATLKVSTILHYLVQHFPKFVYNLPPKPDHTTRHREGA